MNVKSENNVPHRISIVWWTVSIGGMDRTAWPVHRLGLSVPGIDNGSVTWEKDVIRDVKSIRGGIYTRSTPQ